MTILRSSRLSAYDDLVFGISTRLGGVSPPPLGMNLSFHVGDDPDNVRRNTELFFGALGIPLERRAIPKQEHTSIVKRVESGGSFPGCDALVTNVAHVFLSISIADCVPVFLFDSRLEAVAAVHAGWRGTVQQIASRAVRSMKEEFGSDPKNIEAYVGPSARSCCYAVGDEVARQFDGSFVRREEGKIFLDLKEANRRQLVDEGIPPDHIEASGYCTICHPELLHSYRRDGGKSGRMLGVIGLRHPQVR